MNNKEPVTSIQRVLVSLILFGSLGLLPAWARVDDPTPRADKAAPKPGAPVRYHTSRFPRRAGEYYGLIWGVDSLRVKAVESGRLIRFTYRVLDPAKAKSLNEKEIPAYLNSPDRNVQLVVPSLEKVGQLRQTGDPEAGRLYWMAFSNPHRTIGPGVRVNIVIGKFHADGLIVE